MGNFCEYMNSLVSVFTWIRLDLRVLATVLRWNVSYVVQTILKWHISSVV